MTSKLNKKEVKDRKSLKEKRDEKLIPIKDVLGLLTNTGINPKNPRKKRNIERRKNFDVL